MPPAFQSTDAALTPTPARQWRNLRVVAGCVLIVGIQLYMYLSSGDSVSSCLDRIKFVAYGQGQGDGQSVPHVSVSATSNHITIRCASPTTNASSAEAHAPLPSTSPLSSSSSCPSPSPGSGSGSSSCSSPCPPIPVSREPIILYVDDLNPDIEGLQGLRDRYMLLSSQLSVLESILLHDETWTHPFTSQETQQLQECNKLIPQWTPPQINTTHDIHRITTQQIQMAPLYLSYVGAWPSGSFLMSKLGDEQKKISAHLKCEHIIDKYLVVVLEPLRAFRRGREGDRRYPLATPGLAKPDTDLPIIAVCMSSTTRGLTVTTKTQLSLFSTTLPSIARHAEPGFEYWIYVSYDLYDVYYDVPGRVSELRAWFDDNVGKPLKDEKGIHARIIVTPFENNLRKPGPAFNFVTRQAYLDGAMYIYRINDDSEFLSPWASKLVSRLLSFSVPYGVVGPVDTNNGGLLTHDFVHRTHHDIFSSHYPPSLTDWWLDDWATLVYGPTRTAMLGEVKVRNTGPAPALNKRDQRYDVDWDRQQALKIELYRGRLQIMKYVREHKLDTQQQQKQQWAEFRKLPIKTRHE